MFDILGKLSIDILDLVIRDREEEGRAGGRRRDEGRWTREEDGRQRTEGQSLRLLEVGGWRQGIRDEEGIKSFASSLKRSAPQT